MNGPSNYSSSLWARPLVWRHSLPVFLPLVLLPLEDRRCLSEVGAFDACVEASPDTCMEGQHPGGGRVVEWRRKEEVEEKKKRRRRRRW